MATDIATLGLAVDSRPVAQARTELDRFGGSASDAEGKTKGLTKATDILTQGYKDLAKAYAAFKIAEHIKEMAMLAARYETMGVVMRVAGNNAGYTNAQMLSYQKTLQTTGISMLQARNALTQMSTANLDLAKSHDLARAAQNLAVVANLNSSETLERMVGAIKSASSETLQTMGLNVSFENGYKTLASQLHTTTEKLTEHQKTTARMNQVLKEAATYNGIYEESLTTAGKQIASMSRFMEDLKVKAGNVFLPVLSQQVADLTKALKEANAELDRQSKTGAVETIGQAALKVYTTVSKHGIIVMQDLAGWFNIVANELAGIAAASERLLHGDWAGFKTVIASVVSDYAGIRKESDAFRAGMTGQVNDVKQMSQGVIVFSQARAKAAAQASEDQAKYDMRMSVSREQARISQGEADRKAQEVEAKKLAASDKARKEREKMVEDYKKLMEAITEKTAADRIEMATQDTLTDGQKYAAKVLDDLRTGVLKLTDAEKRKLAGKLEEYLLAEKAKLAQEAELKIAQGMLEANVKATEQLMEKVAALQEEVTNYGLSTRAINNNTIAKLQAQLATGDLNDAETSARQAQIRLLEKLTDLSETLDAKKTATKVAEAQKDEWKKTMETVDKTFHDGFVAMLAGGTDSWKSWTASLKTTFKSAVADELYKMFAKPFVVQVMAAAQGIFGGGGSGASSVLGGSGGSGINFSNVASLVSAGKTIYSGFAMGLSGSVGSGITSVGSLFGSNAMIAYGNGVAGGASGAAVAAELSQGSAIAGGSATAGASAAGASAGAYAIPIAGWIAAGMATANALYQSGWDPNNGTTSKGASLTVGSGIMGLNEILKGVGLSNTAANIFSGASTFTRLFGRQNPQVKDFGLEGTFNGSGFTGDAYQNIQEKGGWFRSDKNYTNKSALGDSAESLFDNTIKNMLSSVQGFAKTMGISADSLLGYQRTIKLELTNDETKNNELIAKMFTDMGDEMATRLVPSIMSVAKEGETASVTLQRVATNYALLDATLTSIGRQFNMVGASSFTARERLIDLMGGIQAVADGADFFAQNFLSEGERLAPVARYVTDEMARLGLASVDTRKEFKDVVLGLDLTTAAGAAQYAALMKVQQAFTMVVPAIENTADAIRTTTDIANERAGLMSELENTLLSSSEQLARQRSRLDDSNKALWDYLQTAKAAKKAQEEMRASLADSITGLKAFGASAKTLRDGLLVGSLSALTPLEQYAETKRQYEANLAAARSGDETARGNYNATATAFLTSSQQINGGDAMYQSDLAGVIKTADEISSWAAGQVDVAQASLDALNAQVDGIQALNLAMQDVAQAVRELPAAIAPAAVDAGGPTLVERLESRISDLVDVVKALRIDQQQQTSDTIGAGAAAAQETAETIVTGVAAAVVSRNYKIQQMQEQLLE
jgi:hypothetical protein